MEVRVYTLKDSPRKGERMVVRTNNRNEILKITNPTYLLDEAAKVASELRSLENELVSVVSLDDPNLMDKLRPSAYILTQVNPNRLSQIARWYQIFRKGGNMPPKEAHAHAKEYLDRMLVADEITDPIKPGMKVWENIKWEDGMRTIPPGYDKINELPTVIDVKIIEVRGRFPT